MRDITVIVPTYNRADLISHTIRSILQQSYLPAEIIVVDDGSADNTREVVEKFGSIVKYVCISNSGECNARNVGVDLARTDWIAFCDSDDLWHPDKLAMQVRLLDANPDLQYCFTNFRTITNGEWSTATKFDSLPEGYWDLPRTPSLDGSFVVLAEMCERILRRQPIFPSTLLMSREFFETVGRWTVSLGRTPSVDLEFHLRCVQGDRIGVVTAPVVGIRKHSSNFSADPLKTTLGEIEILRYVLRNNPHAHAHAPVIREQIVRRTAQAAASAFVAGDYGRVCMLVKSIPWYKRPFKLQVKAALSQWWRLYPQRAA